ncbi:MAG: type I methionyl aminopeptidase [Candidatus Vogelbacteria bacterium]|nr:type I methionyl aminopeptidase [Candidatus Vogelbacteria bacterium]
MGKLKDSVLKLKTPAEIEILRAGGRRLTEIIRVLIREVRPGVTTAALEQLARRQIKQAAGRPSFLNYRPAAVPPSAGPFPTALCVSVNDEVVHGIPGERVLLAGDIVSLDLGLEYEGLFTDMAVTVPVGRVSAAAANLIRVTARALKLGIAAARPSARLGDIGAAIEQFVTARGFGLVREFGGHGVGFRVHEEPEVPNYGRAGQGLELEPGLVIAIEPMVTVGDGAVNIAADGFTVRTEDNSLAAHFEHTIAVTEQGPEILTRI